MTNGVANVSVNAEMPPKCLSVPFLIIAGCCFAYTSERLAGEDEQNAYF
jgi:hypothetical protein